MKERPNKISWRHFTVENLHDVEDYQTFTIVFHDTPEASKYLDSIKDKTCKDRWNAFMKIEEISYNRITVSTADKCGTTFFLRELDKFIEPYTLDTFLNELDKKEFRFIYGFLQHAMHNEESNYLHDQNFKLALELIMEDGPYYQSHLKYME